VPVRIWYAKIVILVQRRDMLYRMMLRYAPLALLFACSAGAQTTSDVRVPASADIFAAGQSVAFSGTLPPVVTFAAGSVEAVTVEASGMITLGAGEPYSAPAGIAFPGGTDLSSFNGLSGIIALDRGFFLTGVFLDDSVPAGSGPPVLNFTGAEDFLTLSPQLFQTFFVGNGGTSSSGHLVSKIFFVPSNGPPGCYDDNVGSFGTAVTLHPFTGQPKSN
jgi:hypothetical protein